MMFLIYILLIVLGAAAVVWLTPGSGCNRDCNQGRNCDCWRSGGKE